MENRWDSWLTVGWRLVAIALIILEASRPKTEVSTERLILYAAMLGLPSVLPGRGSGDR